MHKMYGISWCVCVCVHAYIYITDNIYIYIIINYHHPGSQLININGPILKLKIYFWCTNAIIKPEEQLHSVTLKWKLEQK